MEAELEKLVKEKEQSVPMTIIPLQSVPITGVSTISATPIAEIPPVVLVTTSDASERIVKSMEDMTLQGEEIKRLQEEINNLQKLKSMFHSSYNIEMHKSQRLTQEIQKL
jgi:hypothetical protein